MQCTPTSAVDSSDPSPSPSSPSHLKPTSSPTMPPTPSTTASPPCGAGLSSKRPRGSAEKTQTPPGKRIKDRCALPHWVKPIEEGCKRSRRPPPRFTETVINRKEEQILLQAIENSKIETRLCCDGVDRIGGVPVYRPTVEEFSDPIRFIESIKDEGARYGIVKIIPPEGWAPPQGTLDLSLPRPFKTKKQSLRYFKEGTGFGDGRKYDFKTYEAMALKFHDQWLKTKYHAQGKAEPTYADLEIDYWRIIETAEEEVDVEYANDLDTMTYGSGFPKPKDVLDVTSTIAPSPAAGSSRKKKGEDEDSEAEEDNDSHKSFIIENIGPDDGRGRVLGTPEYYERCGWNLNNLPLWPGSVLRYIHTPLKGVNVPWLYMGMLFSTFCWHNEDNFMYSLNYLHQGAPKQWYTVPGSKAEAMEKVMRGFLRETFQKAPDLLHHMTTHFSPMLFQSAGVPVFKALQEPGQFIVTFPKSFHAGFNYGYNCAEAVNFSPPAWLTYGREAIERYRRFARNPVFSHDRLVLTLATNLSKEWSVASLRALLDDLTLIVREEEFRRKELKKQGLRFDVVEKSKLLPNDLRYMDNVSLDYDEKRVCLSCRHVCFLSAVACECNGFKVSCLREVAALCDCKMNQRYIMAWHEIDELWELVKRVDDCLQERMKAEAAVKKETEYGKEASSAKEEKGEEGGVTPSEGEQK